MVIEMVNAIIWKDNKILLVKRADAPVWEVPSGHKEKNETFEEAAVREAKEETGLNVKIARYLGEYRNTYHGKPVIRKVYVCSILSGKLEPNNEISRQDYYSCNKLPRGLVFWFRQPIIDSMKEDNENLSVEQKFGIRDYLIFFMKNPFLALYIPLFLRSEENE